MTVQQDRFAIDDLAAHDLPDGTVVARNRRTGAQMTLPGEIFNVLTHCHVFRTMEEHIAHVAGPGARGREREIRNILQTVINGGMALSAAAIAARLEPQQGGPVDDRPVAAIITCERPQALSRLLASMQESCELEGVECLVVVDDSRSRESLAANHDAIAAARPLLESAGLKAIQHFTPAAAATLVDRLVDALPEHETGIRFLLDRRGREDAVTTGITRNLAQVVGAGLPLLVFDDDVLCHTMDPPEQSTGVEFAASQRGCRFYVADADWADRRSQSQPCPVQAHMKTLGSTLAVSLSTLGCGRPLPEAFEHATPGFARRLEPGNRVLVTQCGSYGDPGSGGNEWIALLPAEERAQLGTIAGDIRLAEEKRNCWLGRNRPVFEPRANMSQLTGLDNRQYLPPYFPLFRGQDRSFGAMAEFLHPQGIAADLPFALPHLPTPRRSWREGFHGFKLPFSLQQFLNDHVTTLLHSCGARDAGNRNEWLATMFLDLAVSPTERIIEITAGHWTQQRIDWLTRLSQAAEESAGTAGHVADYLRSVLSELRSAGVPQFSAASLKGPPDDLAGDAVLEYWRGAWRDFAAGLRAWPAVREAADEILN